MQRNIIIARQLMRLARHLLSANNLPAMEMGDDQMVLPYMTIPKEVQIILNNKHFIWDQIMKRMGIPLGEVTVYMGSGGHGVVLNVGSNVLLKLTQDIAEASAAFILQYNPMPEAYRVYDVFRVNVAKLGNSPVWRYGIVMERLLPADPDHAGAIAEWEFMFGTESLTPERVQELIDIEIENFQAAGIDITQDVDLPTAPKSPYRIFLWLKTAARHLLRRHIHNKDLKPDNIMRRMTGEHVLIDFGGKSIVPVKRIPLLTSQSIPVPKFGPSDE